MRRDGLLTQIQPPDGLGQGGSGPLKLTVELPVCHWGHRAGTFEGTVGGLEHHQRQVRPVALNMQEEKNHEIPNHDPASLTLTCAFLAAEVSKDLQELRTFFA